jgi:coenzyme F420-reducing hydrogenase delta subunit
MQDTTRRGDGHDAGGEPREARRNIVAFRCAGASAEGRPSQAATEAGTLPVHEISVPCSGRLQPEHLLKAFEAGADLVLLVTCRDGDCRYLEGRRRIQQRVDYVRGLLDEIGLGGERLLLPEPPAAASTETDATPQPDMIQEALAAALAGLAPNPLGRSSDERVG